jgi:hypothetical protein
MKRLTTLVGGALCALVLVGNVAAADAVEPATNSFAWTRGDGQQESAGEQVYYRGTTLLFTNCVLHSGMSAPGPTQGLAGVSIELRVGSTASNVAYAATGSGTNDGRWWCSVTVPSNAANPYLQLKITDSNTNSYIYPWKVLKTAPAL